MMIAINAIAPNLLYGEAYYPRARFLDDPAGRDDVMSEVPAGRLGRPDEIGDLIRFLDRIAVPNRQHYRFFRGLAGREDPSRTLVPLTCTFADLLRLPDLKTARDSQAVAIRIAT
jgi:hypothetical protein